MTDNKKQFILHADQLSIGRLVDGEVIDLKPLKLDSPITFQRPDDQSVQDWVFDASALPDIEFTGTTSASDQSMSQIELPSAYSVEFTVDYKWESVTLEGVVDGEAFRADPVGSVNRLLRELWDDWWKRNGRYVK